MRTEIQKLDRERSTAMGRPQLSAAEARIVTIRSARLERWAMALVIAGATLAAAEARLLMESGVLPTVLGAISGN